MSILKILKYFVLVLFPLTFLNARIETHFRSADKKSGLHWMAQIDFIYMLNLDQNPEKYERTMRVLQPYGIYPYRFPAINEEELTIQALDELGVIYQNDKSDGPLSLVFRQLGNTKYQSYEIMKEIGAAYYNHSLSLADICNLLSHLSILQDAYDSGYKNIWVLKDNIKIVGNPNELSRLVSVLNVLAPDWDVFFTDNEVKGFNGEPVIRKILRPRPYGFLHTLEHYLTHTLLSEDLTKIGMRYGDHSMVISRSGIKKILDYFKVYKFYFPYDIDCCLIPGINLFSSNVDIITNLWEEEPFYPEKFYP